mgnify:CR=1 FL=1
MRHTAVVTLVGTAALCLGMAGCTGMDHSKDQAVRDVAARLNAEKRIDAYVVESENFESIHNHSAYALIERDKRQDNNTHCSTC